MTKPPFKVTSAEVVIIWPGISSPFVAATCAFNFWATISGLGVLSARTVWDQSTSRKALFRGNEYFTPENWRLEDEMSFWDGKFQGFLMVFAALIFANRVKMPACRVTDEPILHFLSCVFQQNPLWIQSSKRWRRSCSKYQTSPRHFKKILRVVISHCRSYESFPELWIVEASPNPLTVGTRFCPVCCCSKNGPTFSSTEACWKIDNSFM